MDLRALALELSVAAPRYTSYPTAPFFQWGIEPALYWEQLAQVRDSVALYVHIPFCRTLCYYCGCNVAIRSRREVADGYIAALEREVDWVLSRLNPGVKLFQLSLGGGTPTYLSISQMERLFRCIDRHLSIGSETEVSIELDPREVSRSYLRDLCRLGMNRVSFGVQDFDPQVQRAVNRVQSYELTQQMVEEARACGIEAINVDLIYGLPFQTKAGFLKTLNRVKALRPTRIACYNYAHLPSKIPHQKILDPYPRPDAAERVDIFIMAYRFFLENGYRLIGMDHFALEQDELWEALECGKLYRNFMGYTVQKAEALLGLGASAISEFEGAYFQNKKAYFEYRDFILESREPMLAVDRGLLLSQEDKIRKWVIQQIMCHFEVDFAEFEKRFGWNFLNYFGSELERLQFLVERGIVVVEDRALRVSEVGRLFVRNVAMCFDAYLDGVGKGGQFSQTV